MTIDEVYTFTDPVVDPTITPVAADSNPINCSGTKTVDFHYTPGDAPEVRGYTVRVACDAPLTFGPDDVQFYTLPSGAEVWPEIRVVTAGQVYDLDYVVLGGSVGIAAEADLFSVTFHGAQSGTGTVSLQNADLRDLVNGSITPVDYSGTAGIVVDCDAPTSSVNGTLSEYQTTGLTFDVPYTAGDGTGSGVDYVELYYQVDGGGYGQYGATYTSSPISFTAAGEGFYEFYTIAYDLVGNVELAPGTADASTTVDLTPPATHVVALDGYQIDSFFDVYYDLDVPGSDGDYDTVELFFKGPGTPDWTYYGQFVDTSTPLQFETGPTGTNTGDGTYFFYSKGTDLAGNFEDPPVDYDATTTVDTSALTVNYFWINDDDDYTSSQNVTLGMDVPDAVEMEFSNDGLTWSGYVAYAATYPWDLGAGEGTKTVYAHFKEVSGHVTDAQDDIILDATPPDAITGLTATRGKEKVNLAWTNPGGDQVGVEMWRAVWHDTDGNSVYPEYSDVTPNYIPTIPTDREAASTDPDWTLVDLSGETFPFASFTDVVPERGIYYYVVYPVDSAANYGGGDDASSISYLLGDIQSPYDGLVYGGDITILSTAYGTTDAGGGSYNNECDVGPTDDWSGSGIPTTDNSIDFDDLMIFALNWGTQLTKVQPAVGSQIARFIWVENDDASWSLMLVEPCANLKGLNLKAVVAQGSDLTVVAGELLKQQDNTYFLKNIPENGLDAGLALLGSGACITGRGELVRIGLTGELDIEDIDIEARDAGNKVLEFTLDEAGPGADLPNRYMLSANYPNPFNPSTKIDFALPEMQHVRLAIYSIDGRLIATLKNETLPAGQYTVTWEGRDDQGRLAASGIYFYRIQAGDFSRMQKMTLVK